MEGTFDFCEQLAQADLSEEDTENLLKEATDLNKKLKAELRRIEEKEKQNVDKSSWKQQRSCVHKSLQKPSSGAAINSGTNDKPKNLFLPPISSSTNRKMKVNEMALLHNSPYSSVTIPFSQATRSRGVPGSILRHSSSAGNPSSSIKVEKDQHQKTSSNSSHSTDHYKASRVSTS